MLTRRLILITSLLFNLNPPLQANPVKAFISPAPNGIEIPANYKNWTLISSAHRLDKHSLRVVLGNDIAVKAVKNKQTNPWPEGTILAKLVWKERQHPLWPEAMVPGDFEHAEFMIKDRQKYTATEGWGFARWLGLAQKPYGETADFAQECVACHAAAKANDQVFTIPAILP